MFSHYSVARKIEVFSRMSTVESNELLLLHPRFWGKLLQTLLSLNVYNKFLDFLFIFPVQVLEDERIEGTN